MKRLALLSLIGMLAAGAAHADPAFDSFRNFCVASRGVSATALAAADAAGWAPVPPQLLAQLPQTEFQGAQGRMQQTTPNTAALLLTATGAMAQVGPVRVCAIGIVPAGASDLAGQLQAFAGVPRQDAPNVPEGMYAWQDVNGARLSVDRNAPDFHARMASGAVLIASTRSTPQMTMILLMSAAQ